MNEAKPFASLSSGLLARKGNAKPAMRPQGFGQFGQGIEDLGWNDMGHSTPPPQDEPAALSPFEQAHDDHVPSPIAALTPMSSSVDEEEEFEPAPAVVEQQRAAIEASFSQQQVDRVVLATKAKKAMGGETVAEEVQAEPEIAYQEPEPEPEIVVKPAPKAVSAPSKPRKVDVSARSKAAFTLRLEADRHLKLRLACAVTGRSAQQLVTEALDQLLQSRPDIQALAGQLPGQAR